MNLGRFPRIRFAHLPTPLEHLPNLSKSLNGPEIWIKRDDCTGMSSGGNKTRKLEFLMAEARAQGADIVLTQGATQSNHARQTAACAARMGVACHILLEDRTGKTDHDYTESGNVLLDHLHGASVERCAANPDMNGELAKAAARMKSEGRKPYLIPGGGSNAGRWLGDDAGERWLDSARMVDAAGDNSCAGECAGRGSDGKAGNSEEAGTIDLGSLHP